MEIEQIQPQAAVGRQLDRELDVVASAIAMVASGAAPRVTVSSLRFGTQLLDIARRMTVGKHVRIVPLYGTDDSACAIAVERVPR